MWDELSLTTLPRIIHHNFSETALIKKIENECVIIVIWFNYILSSIHKINWTHTRFFYYYCIIFKLY